MHLLFCGRYELVIGAPEHRSATSVVLRARDLGEKTDYGKVFDDADKDTSGTLDREELGPVAARIGLDAELFLRAEDKSIDRSSFVRICKHQLGDGQRSVRSDRIVCPEALARPYRGRVRDINATGAEKDRCEYEFLCLVQIFAATLKLRQIGRAHV